MNLSTLFSLIAASIFALLPVLLLLGRRRMLRRDLDAASPESPDSQTEENAQDAARREESGESAILTRVVRESSRRRGDTPRRREAREAAVVAGMPRPQPPQKTEPPTWTAFEDRVNRLTPLQKAIVFREVLGKPLALRPPGGWEDG